MHPMGKRRAGAMAVLPTLLVAFTGCVHAPPSAVRGQDPDEAAFAAVLAHLRPTDATELLVDPRPVLARADLATLEPFDLAPEHPATARMRGRVLRRLGIRAGDALVADGCRGSTPAPPPPGAPPRPLPPDTFSTRCAALGPFTMVIVSEPVPAGDVDGRPTWTMRAARLTNWYYEVHDLRLGRDARGAVVVVSDHERVIDSS